MNGSFPDRKEGSIILEGRGEGKTILCADMSRKHRVAETGQQEKGGIR